MIYKLIKAIDEKDSISLAQCFDRNCTYHDFCPSIKGHKNYMLLGQIAVEMFFRNKFMQEEFVMVSAVIKNENEAQLFGIYNGDYIRGDLSITCESKTGLITYLTVFPAVT